MSAVHQVRWRLLREHVERMVAAAEWARNDDARRLALCCRTLLDRHPVDGKGRCRRCPSRWGWPWRRRCVVLPTVWFYVEQPASILTDDTRSAMSEHEKSDPGKADGRRDPNLPPPDPREPAPGKRGR